MRMRLGSWGGSGPSGRPRPRLAQSTQARMHPSNGCASTIAKAYTRESTLLTHPERSLLGLFRCIIRVSQGRVEQKVFTRVCVSLQRSRRRRARALCMQS